MPDGLSLRKMLLAEPDGLLPGASAVDQAVRAARLEFAFGSQPMSLAVAVILAAMTCGVLKAGDNELLLLTWFSGLFGLNVARFAQYRRYREACVRGQADLARWDRTLFLGCVASGAVWGAAALLFLPKQPALQFFLAFVIAGVSAGAVSGLAVAPLAAYGFVIPCVLPLTIRFVASGDLLHWVMGAMTALYTIILTLVARRGDIQLRRLVSSQMDAQASRHALVSSEVGRRLSDERLRVAAEAGEIGVWEWDLGSNVLVWDERMHQLYRVNPVAGSNNYEIWRQRLHPSDLARVESQLKACVLGAGDFRSEFRIIWPSGAERWIRACATRVQDAAGSAVRVTGINLDITGLRRLENIKREFVSTVSHELRTPLTSIRGSLGLIINHAAGEVSDPVKELLRVADRNAERLAALIEDLLDIEKLEAGRLQLELTPQLVGPLIEQAVSANAPYARAHQVSFALTDNALDAWAAVDGKRVLQVMTNLLSNAVKFSPAGAPVEIVIGGVAGQRIRVEVRDHGPGISREFQPQVFTKFSQGDSSDSRSKGGTGLGLALSKALTEQMGGTIGFETTIGAGTMFFLELPKCVPVSGRLVAGGV
jgi:signal transduction histidine kinase